MEGRCIRSSPTLSCANLFGRRWTGLHLQLQESTRLYLLDCFLDVGVLGLTVLQRPSHHNPSGQGPGPAASYSVIYCSLYAVLSCLHCANNPEHFGLSWSVRMHVVSNYTTATFHYTIAIFTCWALHICWWLHNSSMFRREGLCQVLTTLAWQDL